MGRRLHGGPSSDANCASRFFCSLSGNAYNREAGKFAILRGAKVAELPVQQPIKYELTINVKTVKTLGLTVPDSLLARVDEVIE